MVFFVIDEYKSSAFQPVDVEARAGIFNSAEPDIPPCISAIIRESLTNAMLAADEHPQRFVPQFDDHVFVSASVRIIGISDAGEGQAIISRGVDI